MRSINSGDRQRNKAIFSSDCTSGAEQVVIVIIDFLGELHLPPSSFSEWIQAIAAVLRIVWADLKTIRH